MTKSFMHSSNANLTKRQNAAQHYKFSQQLARAIRRFAVANRYDKTELRVLSAHTTSARLIITSMKSHLRALSLFIRNNTYCQGANLTDIVGTDRLRSAKARFAIQYLFFSDRFRKRVSLELFSSDTESVPSLATNFFRGQRIFAAAAGLEREVGDLFGVFFSQHGDLRRLLTDYGFSGHPLRKDFPQSGFIELVYSDVDGRITRSDVELAQEYRVFKLD